MKAGQDIADNWANEIWEIFWKCPVIKHYKNSEALGLNNLLIGLEKKKLREKLVLI